MTHPRAALDKELTAPLRLSIAAALAAVEDAEFAAVRDAVETNDAELSRQVSRLESVGYVAVSKKKAGRYARTWLALTPEGRDRLAAHIRALREITG